MAHLGRLRLALLRTPPQGLLEDLCLSFAAALADERLSAALPADRELAGAAEVGSTAAALCRAHVLGLARCRRAVYDWQMPAWALESAAGCLRSLAEASSGGVCELGLGEGAAPYREGDGAATARAAACASLAAGAPSGRDLEAPLGQSSSPAASPAAAPGSDANRSAGAGGVTEDAGQPASGGRLAGGGARRRVLFLYGHSAAAADASSGAASCWFAHVSEMGVVLTGAEAHVLSAAPAAAAAPSAAVPPSKLASLGTALSARALVLELASERFSIDGKGVRGAAPSSLAAATRGSSRPAALSKDEEKDSAAVALPTLLCAVRVAPPLGAWDLPQPPPVDCRRVPTRVPSPSPADGGGTPSRPQLELPPHDDRGGGARAADAGAGSAASSALAHERATLFSSLVDEAARTLCQRLGPLCVRCAPDEPQSAPRDPRSPSRSGSAASGLSGSSVSGHALLGSAAASARASPGGSPPKRRPPAGGGSGEDVAAAASAAGYTASGSRTQLLICRALDLTLALCLSERPTGLHFRVTVLSAADGEGGCERELGDHSPHVSPDGSPSLAHLRRAPGACPCRPSCGLPPKGRVPEASAVRLFRLLRLALVGALLRLEHPLRRQHAL